MTLTEKWSHSTCCWILDAAVETSATNTPPTDTVWIPTISSPLAWPVKQKLWLEESSESTSKDEPLALPAGTSSTEKQQDWLPLPQKMLENIHVRYPLKHGWKCNHKIPLKIVLLNGQGWCAVRSRIRTSLPDALFWTQWCLSHKSGDCTQAISIK